VCVFSSSFGSTRTSVGRFKESSVSDKRTRTLICNCPRNALRTDVRQEIDLDLNPSPNPKTSAATHTAGSMCYEHRLTSRDSKTHVHVKGQCVTRTHHGTVSHTYGHTTRTGEQICWSVRQHHTRPVIWSNNFCPANTSNTRRPRSSSYKKHKQLQNKHKTKINTNQVHTCSSLRP
jgi:hypothetical protein